MMDLNALNLQQRLAVETTEGPLLVLAGAGSGKTRVLTYRVAKLIEDGVPPWKILAITFTNKAAREMAARIAALAGAEASEVWVSTFHACCARILRRDIEKLGYKRQFAIYDEDDRLTLIKSILKELNLSDKEYPPRQVRAVISDAKNRLLTPAEWLKDAGDSFRNKHLSEVYTRYEDGLRANNALDFDDLLLKTLELFAAQPPVLDYYRNRFDYILVDEYQDTNAAQYELVRLLAGEKRNLCVVGDDDQSIYGWRGADIRNILDFEKDFPDAKVVKLERNYRSTANILDAANQVIAHNQGRKEKALWTEAGEGEKITLYRALDERDEAAYIASMARQASQKYGAGQVAVLYRTNAQSRVLEEAFVRSGTAYRVYGGLKFYDRKEVKDLIAYMRAIVNPDDDVSTRRIINEPKRAIGDATVEALLEYGRENELSLLGAALDVDNVALSTRAASAVRGFAELMIDLTEALYEHKPSAFLDTLLQKTGYARQFEANPSDENTADVYKRQVHRHSNDVLGHHRRHGVYQLGLACASGAGVGAGIRPVFRALQRSYGGQGEIAAIHRHAGHDDGFPGLWLHHLQCAHNALFPHLCRRLVPPGVLHFRQFPGGRNLAAWRFPRRRVCPEQNAIGALQLCHRLQ